MDDQLDQAPQHHTAISSTLYKNYLVHSVHNAVKTLALLLALLTNIADWSPSKPNQASMRPDLCHFLEDVIVQLTSRAGKSWQIQFKASKHLGITILIKVQMVVAYLVSAALQTNIQGLSFDQSINHNCFTNLAKLLQLINYFKEDLDRAITSNEPHTFPDVPPIYTTLMEASTKNRPQDRDRDRDRDWDRNRTQDRDRDTHRNPETGRGGDSSRYSPCDNNNNSKQMQGIFGYPGNVPQFKSHHNPDSVPICQS